MATSYAFKRRTFLQGLGGAVGLKIMLRNLEAAAAGGKSPPRLLVTYWPLGTIRPDFIPTIGNTGSPILKPLGDAGLAGDMTAFYGLSTAAMAGNGSSGHEGGVVKMMTGLAVPGTRAGEIEADDGYAGGPSFDQIFLKHATALQRPGLGYANSIADSRVDFGEISAQCLSYSTVTRDVAQAIPTPSIGRENVPLLPVLNPLAQWTNLFATFTPNGTGGSPLIKALRQRKSVLDLSLRQLARLKTLAPAHEAPKIDIHAQAIRDVEVQLTAQIQSEGGLVCGIPAMPPAGISGQSGSANNYGNPKAAAPDTEMHAMAGKLHMDILKAAFVCDLIRVGTFQWASANSKIAFQGLLSSDPPGSYMHHPISHRLASSSATLVPKPTRDPVVDFLSGVHTWYNQQMATIVSGWKATQDGMGGNLLDATVMPFLSEVTTVGHEQNNLPAILFGGKALGFQQGQFLNINRPLNDLWLTIAQGFGLSATVPPFSGEKFIAEGQHTGPIDGLWTQPP